MTRILDVRFLVTLVMTTFFIGCSGSSGGGGSQPPPPPQQKFQDFMSLKQQIVTAGIPLDASDFQNQVQSSAYNIAANPTAMANVRRLLHRYVDLGNEIQTAVNRGSIGLSDPATFQDNLGRGRSALQIVESTQCTSTGDCQWHRTPDWDDDHSRPRAVPPQLPGQPPPIRPHVPVRPSSDESTRPLTNDPNYTPAKGAALCKQWADYNHRPCSVQKGRLEQVGDHSVFVPDSNGREICHCPSGSFETHSDH